MNPYRLKNVFEYLTSNNQLLKKKLKLGTSEIPIPPKRKDVIDIEAINRFNKANPRVDTTSLKPLSVKHSKVKQSNVDQADEGVIQGAFDTATREAQQSGFPAPNYEKFKSRYLKKNMKAEGGRAGYEDGGMLVQPSDDGSRPGYKGTPLTGDEKLIKEWEKTLTDAVKKKDMTKTVGFSTFLDNKFKDKKKVNTIRNRILNQLNYKAKNRYSEIQENFARSLIKNHNNADKILYNRGEIFRRAKIDDASVLGQSLLEIMNDPKIGMDDINTKINKAFNKIVNGEVVLKKPKNITSVLKNYSLIPQMIGDISGVRNVENIKSALQFNSNFKDKNFVQVFNYLNKSGLAKDFIGSNFDEVFEYAKFRQGGLDVKGLLSYTTRYQNPESNILNFAVRHANRHFRDGTSEESLVKFYKKRANGTKGAPINFENLPRDRDGNRILDLSKVGFEYEDQFFHKENLKTKGFKSGLFQEIYDLSGKNRLKVPDPNNPSKKITLQQLLKMTGDKLTIGHDEASGGVKGKPFNGLQLQGGKLNTALFNAYDKIQNKQLRKLILNELQLVVPKGIDYETAFINKSIADAKNIVNNTSDTLYRQAGKNVVTNLGEDFFKKSKPFQKETMRVAGLKNEKEIKSLIASFGGGTCSVFSGKKANLKADGGRIGLQAGTPDIDECYDAATAVINSGKVPVDKADDFAQLLKRVGNIGRGIMKYGIIPEALYATADSLVRVGMGDTFKEAGLRATDYLLPGDQTKAAEISKVSRVFGDETGELVGRTIDYKNQLAKIQSLEDQKLNFENLSGGGEFDYIGDLSGDVKNTENLLLQAKNDLNNKFKISEAEQLFAESKQDDAYDASKATSFLSNLKRKYRDSSDNLSDVETLAAPEKTQMQLNLNMLPTAPREYMTATDDQIKKFVEQENATGSKLNAEEYINFRDQLKDDFMTKGPGVYGKEQVYGANATFGGEPVDMTNYKPSNRFGSGSQQRPVLYPDGRGTLAGGGIASLTKTIPPESGPTPHGLPYVYNNVKKI